MSNKSVENNVPSKPSTFLLVNISSICVCGKDDQRYSIVFNVKSIYLFPYFGVSLDLYHYLLLA